MTKEQVEQALNDINSMTLQGYDNWVRGIRTLQILRDELGVIIQGKEEDKDGSK